MGTLEPSLLGSTPHLLDSSSMVLRRTGFFFFNSHLSLTNRQVDKLSHDSQLYRFLFPLNTFMQIKLKPP